MTTRTGPRRGRAGAVLAVAAVLLVGAWTVAVAVLVPVAVALVGQALAAAGADLPWWGWPLAGAAVTGLVGVPALALALVAGPGRVRAAGRAW